MCSSKSTMDMDRRQKRKDWKKETSERSEERVRAFLLTQPLLTGEKKARRQKYLRRQTDSTQLRSQNLAAAFAGMDTAPSYVFKVI